MDWLTPDLQVLCITAVSLAMLHTLIGPDHYLPFIALGKSRNWSTAKTLKVTGLFGLGHAAGSVVLGFIGIALGTALNALVNFESWRADLAAWALTAFGLCYLVFSLRKALRGGRRAHVHMHVHADGTVHSHEHHHREASHLHPHERPEGRSLAYWSLFFVFVLGPCEALIPLLMYPASQNNIAGVWLVTGLFVTVTLLTMLSAVWLGMTGLKRVRGAGLERYSGVIAGSAIACCGAAMLAGF